MPCHRCGARQTDPVRGASPWRRGVRAGEQVLVCPDCQLDRDWTADLAHCAACGSARLARALGGTRCKDCGAEDHVTPETAPAAEAAPEPRTGVTTLSEDVHAALERHFGHRTD
jgi:predicted amidophosphoribosyltransferase